MLHSALPARRSHRQSGTPFTPFVYPVRDRPGDNSAMPDSRLPRPRSAPIALALMTFVSKSTFVLGHRHLLGIEGLSAADITGLLDLSEEYVELNRQVDKKRTSLRGRTQINLFFEASTRTQSSFELAGKRLGADVMNMSVSQSSIRKGETLMDTAVTLNAMGARVRVVAPSTLLPRGIERMGVEVARDMREGLNGADIVMMLRLQRERMNGSFVPSSQEYFHYFGLDQKKLAYAKPDALVMHPGPMNRGVEIDSIVADG